MLALTALASLALGGDLSVGGPRLAAIGDVDGDRISELAIAFPRGLEVYSGATGCRLRSWSLGNLYGARQVWTVAPAGDVDGDGSADVAVTSLQRMKPLPPRSLRFTDYDVRGRVEIYSVRNGACLRAFPEKGLSGGGFGYAIDGGGDFNADAIPDLAVASPARLDEAVTVLCGATGEVLSTWPQSALRIRAQGAGWRDGVEVPSDAPTGPFDVTFNDGNRRPGEEVVLSIYGVVLALGDDGSIRASSQGTSILDPRPIDDLTGDGVPELAGGYTIVDGHSLDELMTLSHMATYPWSSQMLGTTTAAPLGDVDGDGAFEYVIGNVDSFGVNSGWAATYTSSSEEATWAETVFRALHAGEPTAQPGYVVDALDDVNGDGARDFAVLALGTRRLSVRSGREPSRVLWSLDLR